MKKVLMFISMMLTYLVHAQDQINWIPFDCNEGSSVRYISLDNYQARFKVNASWPENETRPVTKWIDSDSIPMGNMPGGEYFITLQHPGTDVAPIAGSGYEAIYVVSLQVGNGPHSEDCDIRTEPTPVISTTASVSSVQGGQMLTITGISHTADTTISDQDGWGGIGMPCTLHEISIITDVFSEGTIVFSDTTVCVPGVPTHFSAEFLYDGPYTELCTRSRMEKRSLANPASFDPQRITYSDEVCQFVGQTENQIAWLPWDCESSSPVYYVSIGDRQTLVRFHASWPENETRTVSKCYENMPCVSIGQFSGGDHVISIESPYQVSQWQYWHSYGFALQISGTDQTTEELFITTEPSPSVETDVEVLSQTNGDSLFITSTSVTAYGTSWGEIMPQCQTHQIFLVHEVREGNTVLFRDSVLWQTQQIPFPLETLHSRFFYKEHTAELCVRAFLKKIDVSSGPTFLPETIGVSEPVCVVVGDGTVGYNDTFADQTDMVHVFPNPCTSTLSFTSSVPLSWQMINVTGAVVGNGRGTNIDMSNMSSGVYTLLFLEKNSHVRVVHE